MPHGASWRTRGSHRPVSGVRVRLPGAIPVVLEVCAQAAKADYGVAIDNKEVVDIPIHTQTNGTNHASYLELAIREAIPVATLDGQLASAAVAEWTELIAATS